MIDKKLAKTVRLAQTLEKGDMASLFVEIVNLVKEVDVVKEELKKLSELDSIQIKGLKGDKPKFGVDFLTPVEMQKIKDELRPIAEGGKDGEDGYTPIVGKDYFTEKDKKDLIKKVVAYIPEGLDATAIAEEVYQKLLLKEPTAQDIADKLNLHEAIIEPEVIKGYSDFVKEVTDPKGKYLNRPEKGPLDQRWHGGGLSTVAHDDTLTGLGTPQSPLSVAGGGGLNNNAFAFFIS